MSLLTSCSSNKKIAYFQTLNDSVRLVEQIKFVEPLIQPDDILNISIQTIDPAGTAAVNQVVASAAIGASTASNSGNQQALGFLVDKNGEIELPMLGALKVGGLSTYGAKDLIRQKASKYFKDPTVQIRFVNYKITVIGEVVRPGTYLLPNERVTVLDALGLAGDLTIYGKRENVLLVRDNAGSKQFIRLNLTSADIFKSEYYYLKQNDVIYVEPNKNKLASSDAGRTRYITIAVSVLTALVLIITKL
ncbi:polysaccharide biosynthesis/export family protein [Mucilaginibacter gynuensis]|uniref:Polysaccharide biosynthesis/export family protein n=2 Tax=Mucilaginibacter gynuensis TaxID=1302236 RepID=A0ABP8GXI2_9SPHI